MFYKNCNLNYYIEKYEDEIIEKGNDIIEKYLGNRKFSQENAEKNNIIINREHINFILEKEKLLRCFMVNKIFRKPISGKYFFKYLSVGKRICSKIFQTYSNENLKCIHFAFFFI